MHLKVIMGSIRVLCDNRSVYDNTAFSDSWGGFSITKSEFNNITHKYGYDNRDGLWGPDNENNTFSSNHFFDNTDGIHIYDSFRNNITNNMFEGNSRGVYLGDGTAFNLVYNNTFDNSNNAEDDGIINYWDNGTIGNVWSDYTGSGSVPYLISGSAGSQDNFPICPPDTTLPEIIISEPTLSQYYYEISPAFDITVTDND